MRNDEIVELAEGTRISVWPASTGGGGETSLLVDPPFVAPVTGHYLVRTDTVERTVRIRRCADPGGDA